jgi:hypothetical protein
MKVASKKKKKAGAENTVTDTVSDPLEGQLFVSKIIA